MAYTIILIILLHNHAILIPEASGIFRSWAWSTERADAVYVRAKFQLCNFARPTNFLLEFFLVKKSIVFQGFVPCRNGSELNVSFENSDTFQ